jgi:hypothetical protein
MFELLAKEKEQGEPVAEYIGNNPDELDLSKRIGLIHRLTFIPLRSKLYTTPQQRKPLTDETRNWIVATCPTPRHIIDAVERMHCIKE